MSRVSLSLYSQSSFFLIKMWKKRIGKEEVRILLRGLFLLLSPTFVTKCLTSSLKNEFFFFGLVRWRPFVRLNRQTAVVVFLLCSCIVIIFTVVAHAQFSHFSSRLYSSLILNWSNLLYMLCCSYLVRNEQKTKQFDNKKLIRRFVILLSILLVVCI